MPENSVFRRPTPDDSGRRRPVPIEGSEYVIDCDMIIPAIGQKAETALIIKDTDIDLTPWEHSMLTIPPCRHQTSDIRHQCREFLPRVTRSQGLPQSSRRPAEATELLDAITDETKADFIVVSCSVPRDSVIDRL